MNLCMLQKGFLQTQFGIHHTLFLNILHGKCIFHYQNKQWIQENYNHMLYRNYRKKPCYTELKLGINNPDL